MSDPTLERTIPLSLFNVDRSGELEILKLEGRDPGLTMLLALYFEPERLAPFLESLRSKQLEAQIVIRVRS